MVLDLNILFGSKEGKDVIGGGGREGRGGILIRHFCLVKKRRGIEITVFLFGSQGKDMLEVIFFFEILYFKT